MYDEPKVSDSGRGRSVILLQGNTAKLSRAQVGQRCSTSRVVIGETQGAAAAGDETSRDQNDDVSFTFGEKLHQPCLLSSAVGIVKM